jgi:hypothetical protein
MEHSMSFETRTIISQEDFKPSLVKTNAETPFRLAEAWVVDASNNMGTKEKRV